jgi:hypothetical protein
MKILVSFAIFAIAAVIAVPPPAFACQIHEHAAGNTAVVGGKECRNVPSVKVQVSALTSGKEDVAVGKENAARGVLRNDSDRSTGRIFQADFF